MFRDRNRFIEIFPLKNFNLKIYNYLITSFLGNFISSIIDSVKYYEHDLSLIYIGEYSLLYGI
jgi:hypothetical protein